MGVVRQKWVWLAKNGRGHAKIAARASARRMHPPPLYDFILEERARETTMRARFIKMDVVMQSGRGQAKFLASLPPAP